ncbi:P-loop ATPase, Sll1717 family [Ensifer sp. ZNC0028]|uniref:P-loop ATPase, Sll1717 family n=1 Tax=Ensifer sp. ZNC0028 TaxID=1339236 RepID=UPI000ADB8552|nr:hypothetical protein [Ensifer sp. ZNC0028]
MGKKLALKSINFGDVDAKNEILKNSRAGDRTFFDSYSIPERIDIDKYLSGEKYFILGLKGTGKTALLRYLHDKVVREGSHSELILFKTHVTEEDRQKLSASAGYQIVSVNDVSAFIQDFKESWKWLIYQKIATKLRDSGYNDTYAIKLYKITGLSENRIGGAIGAMFSKLSSGTLKFSGDALGVALELGVEIVSRSEESGKASLSDINRACSELLKSIRQQKNLYIFFDELELFYQTPEQFDRDRRIIRDLIYAISHINAESAEYGRRIFLISSLRTEVLHSVLELGHEIGRDVDDYGDRLDWSSSTDGPEHPLLKIVARKISVSSETPVSEVWRKFFPEKINNQDYFKFILNSSYYRPRDIVRLLRVARDYNNESDSFTTAHFDQTSLEYSRQTWLEITEELLASYRTEKIAALQRFFLGFSTHFKKIDIESRVAKKYESDSEVNELFNKRDISRTLSDLYRIGVLGNDFAVRNSMGSVSRRNRWIFRGNTTLNDAERMTIHKSLWKHLSMVPGSAP